jgi:hypothetical protein
VESDIRAQIYGVWQQLGLMVVKVRVFDKILESCSRFTIYDFGFTIGVELLYPLGCFKK